MAELYPRYPSSLLTNERGKLEERQNKTKKERKRAKGIIPFRPMSLLSPKPWARSIPLHLHLGRNFLTSVATRKSITAWSHSSMEKSSEICTCQHLPAFQPVTFSTAFHTSLWWSLNWLQWPEEVLPYLGHCPSTPPSFVVISVAEPL